MDLKRVTQDVNLIVNDNNLFIDVKEEKQLYRIEVDYIEKIRRFHPEDKAELEFSHFYATKESTIYEVPVKAMIIQTYFKTPEEALKVCILQCVRHHRVVSIEVLLDIIRRIKDAKVYNKEWDDTLLNLMQRWYSPLEQSYLVTGNLNVHMDIGIPFKFPNLD